MQKLWKVVEGCFVADCEDYGFCTACREAEVGETDPRSLRTSGISALSSNSAYTGYGDEHTAKSYSAGYWISCGTGCKQGFATSALLPLIQLLSFLNPQSTILVSRSAVTVKVLTLVPFLSAMGAIATAAPRRHGGECLCQRDAQRRIPSICI